MKSARGILFFMLTILLLPACNRDNKIDDTVSADSMVAPKDTASSLNTGVEKPDADFVAEAAGGNLAQIELGKLAQQRGRSKRVKRFGAMMVMDHSKINDKLKALAVIKKIQIPTAPGADVLKAIDQLSKKAGADFDRAYIKSIIEGHENDIKAFENATKKSFDPDVKIFAKKTLPILQAHLDAINAVSESMK